MTVALLQLIAQARRLAGDDPCRDGEACIWVTEGGRPCPFADVEHLTCVNHSQAVYRCSRCDVYDYGDPGGPGHRDCSHGGRTCEGTSLL